MTLGNAVISLGMLSLMVAGSLGQPKIKGVSTAATTPSSGKEMFNSYCAVCHGVSGTGDGPAATALKKKPADLTQLAAKYGGKFPDNRIAQYISGDETVAAHGTREMPIWGEVFQG